MSDVFAPISTDDFVNLSPPSHEHEPSVPADNAVDSELPSESDAATSRASSLGPPFTQIPVTDSRNKRKVTPAANEDLMQIALDSGRSAKLAKTTRAELKALVPMSSAEREIRIAAIILGLRDRIEGPRDSEESAETSKFLIPKPMKEFIDKQSYLLLMNPSTARYADKDKRSRSEKDDIPEPGPVTLLWKMVQRRQDISYHPSMKNNSSKSNIILEHIRTKLTQRRSAIKKEIELSLGEASSNPPVPSLDVVELTRNILNILKGCKPSMTHARCARAAFLRNAYHIALSTNADYWTTVDKELHKTRQMAPAVQDLYLTTIMNQDKTRYPLKEPAGLAALKDGESHEEEDEETLGTDGLINIIPYGTLIVRNLPLEVLSHIFSYVAPPLDLTSRSLRLYRNEKYPDAGEDFTPLLLQVVCSQWLHAARSTPQLWTSLVLDVASIKRVQPSISILETYLKNAKNLSFSLELNLDKKNLPINAVKDKGDTLSGNIYNPAGYALLQPFHSIIFETPENSRRIKVLRLSELPPAWSILAFHEFTRLEELRLGSECKRDNFEPMSKIFAYLHLSPLKRLFIKNTWILCVPDSISHIPSVTILNLFRTTADNCLRSLLLFPNLIEFRARECHFHASYALEDLDLSQEFTLSQLEVLEWCFNNDPLSLAFLENAHLPVLRTFGWGGSIVGIEPSTLTLFFTRISSSLLSLELIDIVGSILRLDYDEYFRLLGHVQRLSLLQIPLWSTELIFRDLCNGECLPCLRELYLIEPPYSKSKHKGGYKEYDKDDQDDKYGDEDARSEFFNMLDCRVRISAGESASFRLGTVDRSLKWGRKDGKKIRAWVESGLDLLIFEDGQPLNRFHEDTGDDHDEAEASSNAEGSEDEEKSSAGSENEGGSGEDEWDEEGDESD
ncbi:hypothetical protein NP233_g7705 [Leucocoprinus birnbaumii]|uniref:F-box domain-containing protein n=1 Tax=Leucocoprinus birnbaumii TaxID=56174 RepID=A0AAD5YNR0_9AGAR|nr:hypothetical protein NP233_g7705 [Leucocoprinus birnbaumii]